MRTSRVSRDTARVVETTSSINGVLTPRRSLRVFAHTTEIPSNIVKPEPASDSDAELSSTPSSLDDGDFALKTTSTSLGKRKRGGTVTPATTATTTSSETIRRSPRKAETSNGSSKPKKARRRPAKHIRGPNGTAKVEPPPNWEEVYNVTAEMRKRVVAPVDTMGCESAAEDHRSPLDRRLQTLVALMLSSQTKDPVTFAAMRNLQENLDGGFNLDGLLKVEPEELNNLIAKVGFHNNKTKYIKATALLLRDKFGGDIPDTIEGMVSLPGVGPKMAYLCMSTAWGRDEGIGVDVHVHRITNLWGWHKTSTPEQTRAELEAWLPREKWHDINHLLVGFGQMICLPVGRKCGECDLAEKGLCPSAVAASPVKKRVKKEVLVKDEEGQDVKAEEVEIAIDDVGVKVEAKLEDDDNVEMQAIVGAEDIEGLGAGTRRTSRTKASARE